MPGHTLLVHPDVDSWVRDQPGLRRRVDWLLFELATRGDAGRPKGIVGPAAEVVDWPSIRWRRSGVGGFHYYAWWFSTQNWDGIVDEPSVVIRAVRHHDDMQPLAAGPPDAYLPRAFDDLAPLTDEQEEIVTSPARVRLVVGQPGTGKTSALIFAAIHEARHLPPDARLLYITLSRRLADQAEETLSGIEDVGRRVRVVPLADLLADWSGLPPSGRDAVATSEESEERAFLSFVAGYAPRDLAVWQDSLRALWAEARAYVLGTAVPFAVRELRGASEPILDEWSYRRLREGRIGSRAARAAWHAARLFVDRRDLPSLQREAWTAIERIRASRLDRHLRALGGLIVDEIQDLTLLQIAVLAEATARIGQLRARDEQAALGHETTPLFVAAGDESQIVHPSGFDWGWCKDLLSSRLGTQPVELTLRANQRSPARLVEIANRTTALYEELRREDRPRGAQAQTRDAPPTGEAALAAAAPDDPDVCAWLGLLAETPLNAIVVDDRTDPTALSPIVGEERFRDVLFSPAQVKGLDRQYVVVWDASRVLARLRDELHAASQRGQQSRFLIARTEIDELRVAVTRATETLVFLDPPGVETDPLLAELLADGLLERRSVAFLRDRLAERSADPRERALGFLEDAEGLLETDPDRALRRLVSYEAVVANQHDPEARRETIERGVEVRRKVASTLVRQGRYAEAADQFERLVDLSREIGADSRAELYTVLARRYREAPPGQQVGLGLLAQFATSFVGVLERLAPEDRTDRLLQLPREWLQEAAAAGDEGAYRLPLPALAALHEAARRLAKLTDEPEDLEQADTLGALLADLLLDAREWSRALGVIRAATQPPPDRLARAYEGLKRWREAGDARLAADQPAEALDDYRRAGAFDRAAELAATLGEAKLTERLERLAEISRALDRLDDASMSALDDDEAESLVRRLRSAADDLARRRRRR